MAKSCTHKRELGQRRGADVGFRANTGRSVDPRWMSAHSQYRTFRSGLRYMVATVVSALPAIGVRSNLKSGIVRGGQVIEHLCRKLAFSPCWAASSIVPLFGSEQEDRGHSGEEPPATSWSGHSITMVSSYS